jgi:hypothetical protein
MEVGRITAFSDRGSISTTCSQCGHKDEYGGPDLAQRIGPDPRVGGQSN